MEKIAEHHYPIGIYTTINRAYLFGRQPPGEFSDYKRRRVENALRKDGIQYLEEHPIIACTIPISEETAIAILDGHHRVRYSGKFNITYIPTLLYSLEQWVDLDARRFDSLNDAWRELINDINAQEIFDHYMPQHKLRPTLIPGIWHPRELVNNAKIVGSEKSYASI